MKKIQFNCFGKSCVVEKTGNPNYFKAVVQNSDMYNVFSFYAMSIQSALYHVQIVVMGVR